MNPWQDTLDQVPVIKLRRMITHAVMWGLLGFWFVFWIATALLFYVWG